MDQDKAKRYNYVFFHTCLVCALTKDNVKDFCSFISKSNGFVRSRIKNVSIKLK